MTKRLDEQVKVFVDVRGRPVCITRGRKSVRAVRLVDEWEEASQWWQGEQPIRVYRVLTSEGAVWELHRFAHGGWRLYRIYD